MANIKNNTAPIKVTPKPDSMNRIYMVVKPLNNNLKINPQNLEKFKRQGFTLVEWGGSILTEENNSIHCFSDFLLILNGVLVKVNEEVH
jgi:hypothetical protein